MPRFAALLVAVLSAGVTAAGCSNEEQTETQRQQLVEQRVAEERRDAARQARQDERIKQLERELRRRESPPQERPSAPLPSPPSSDQAAVPTSMAGGDWPGGTGHTVVLASETTESQARELQRQASDSGLDAGVLFSSDFSSLRPGYFVVFSGTFQAQEHAAQRQTRARSLGFSDAYVRFVAP